MHTGRSTRTNTGTQTLTASSSAVLATRTSVFHTTTEVAALALSVSGALMRSDRIAASRHFTNRGGRALWATAQPRLTLRDTADRRGPLSSRVTSPPPVKPEKAAAGPPAAAGVAETNGATEPGKAGGPADPAKTTGPGGPAKPEKPAATPASQAAEKGHPSASYKGDAADKAGAASGTKDGAADGGQSPAAKPDAPAKPTRVHLTIDSLQNYELIEPIPVVIDPLGDTVFVAETPDLNISITATSIGGAFLQLKDQISAIYENYRSKKFLDPERKRQLKMLETYIGKPKRAWYMGRE